MGIHAQITLSSTRAPLHTNRINPFLWRTLPGRGGEGTNQGHVTGGDHGHLALAGEEGRSCHASGQQHSRNRGGARHSVIKRKSRSNPIPSQTDGWGTVHPNYLSGLVLDLWKTLHKPSISPIPSQTSYWGGDRGTLTSRGESFVERTSPLARAPHLRGPQPHPLKRGVLRPNRHRPPTAS